MAEDSLTQLRSNGWKVGGSYQFIINGAKQIVWAFVHSCGKRIDANGPCESEHTMLGKVLDEALEHRCNSVTNG